MSTAEWLRKQLEETEAELEARNEALREIAATAVQGPDSEHLFGALRQIERTARHALGDTNCCNW